MFREYVAPKFNDIGTVSSVIPLQFLNASSSIDVTVSGIVKFCIPVHP